MPRLVWRALGKSPFMICPPPVSLSFDFSKNTVYLYSTYYCRHGAMGFRLTPPRRAGTTRPVHSGQRHLRFGRANYPML